MSIGNFVENLYHAVCSSAAVALLYFKVHYAAATTAHRGYTELGNIFGLLSWRRLCSKFNATKLFIYDS